MREVIDTVGCIGHFKGFHFTVHMLGRFQKVCAKGRGNLIYTLKGSHRKLYGDNRHGDQLEYHYNNSNEKQ